MVDLSQIRVVVVVMVDIMGPVHVVVVENVHVVVVGMFI